MTATIEGVIGSLPNRFDMVEYLVFVYDDEVHRYCYYFYQIHKSSNKIGLPKNEAELSRLPQTFEAFMETLKHRPFIHRYEEIEETWEEWSP